MAQFCITCRSGCHHYCHHRRGYAVGMGAKLTGPRVGEIFGFWTVVGEPYRDDKSLCLVPVKCKCGTIGVRRRTLLTSGRSASCGCEKSSLMKLHAQVIHGDCRDGRSRLYRIWQAMRQRTENPRATRWKYYGGKGVKVCSAWQEWPAFRDWSMSNGYAADLQIDRIDADGPYAPENCRWISQSENVARANRRAKVNGETR